MILRTMGVSFGQPAWADRRIDDIGEDLATEIGRRYGAPVQMMQLNHGIFDEANVSVIES
jgi:hypothetical protein